MLDAGVGFVPEDRTETDSSASSPSPRTSCSTDRLGPSSGPRPALGDLAAFATAKVAEFDIRTQGIETRSAALRRQPAEGRARPRALPRPALFVAAQPTRGIDVGSIEFVHKRIVETRDSGVPVIVVSTELDEVVALADRIAVMYRGRIVGIVPGTPRAMCSAS